jgi:hypothetical protein
MILYLISEEKKSEYSKRFLFDIQEKKMERKRNVIAGMEMII